MSGMRPRRKPQPESRAAEKPPAKQEASPAAKAVSPVRAAPAPAPAPPPAMDEVPGEGLGDRLHREMLWFDSFLRRWLARLMVFGTHLTIALVACYFIVWSVARGRSYDTIDLIPQRYCGLVLGGTAPKANGRDDVFFTSRIQAAAELYRVRKVQYLIVSGDGSKNSYDEPTAMKAALVAKGVPADHIYCDYAGFHTLDSVVRADRVFGQQRYTIISQAYQNPRALYIARRKGLVDCVAFNAPGAGASSTVLMHLRELALRVMAILDVEFLKTAPKFLGDKVEVSDKHPPVDTNPPPKK